MRHGANVQKRQVELNCYAEYDKENNNIFNLTRVMHRSASDISEDRFFFLFTLSEYQC